MRWADYAGFLDGSNVITRVDISEGRRQCQSDTDETDISILGFRCKGIMSKGMWVAFRSWTR